MVPRIGVVTGGGDCPGLNAVMAFLAAQFSHPVEARTLTFVKEFGLVLFVFTIDLQLGPGLFGSLRAA